MVAEGGGEGSILGPGEVGLQCRVREVELGGLEWEVRMSSELGEPELRWGIVSGQGEVGANPELVELELGWVVEVASEFGGLWEVVESFPELGVPGWLVKPASKFGELK